MTAVITRDETVALLASDGLPLRLRHLWAPGPSRGPVLLVHGAGNRGEVFRPPGGTTLVDALLAENWDVWLLDWRASKSVGLVPWTLDQAARYDHPAVVRHVLEASGADSLQIISHCVGSASVSMAAVAGRLPGVSTVITNGFSLHPVVPPLSAAKLRFLVPLVGQLTRSVSPEWGDNPEGLLAWLMRLLVRCTHRECRNDVCRMASFIFGGGSSALWDHDRIDTATHQWLRHEFGAVPLTFFEEIGRAVRSGSLVPDVPPQTDARFVLLAGQRNRTFLPESQSCTFRYLDRHQPGRHRLHLVSGYGHLDLFIGRDAATDVFPLILTELAGG